MSNVLRGVARVSVLALIVGFAPAASAVSRALPTVEGEKPAKPSDASPATVQVARETAAPDAIRSWVGEAVAAHEEKLEDERVFKAIEAEAARLSPGRYVWRPERAGSGPVEVVVSIKAQRAYVFRNRKLIAVSTVSTGRRGNATPTGTFPILQKARVYFSNLYNDAPMPNMQRLTWDGIALHAGAIPGYPASHGCVRLPLQFSKLLYDVTSMGSVVHVLADDPGSMAGALQFAEQAAASGGREQARAR